MPRCVKAVTELDGAHQLAGTDTDPTVPAWPNAADTLPSPAVPVQLGAAGPRGAAASVGSSGATAAPRSGKTPKSFAAEMKKAGISSTSWTDWNVTRKNMTTSRSVKSLGRAGIGEMAAGRPEADSSRADVVPVHVGVPESADVTGAEFAVLVLAAAAPRWAARP
jgi:hypothetical protein